MLYTYMCIVFTYEYYHLNILVNLFHFDPSIKLYIDLSICTFISNRRGPFSRHVSKPRNCVLVSIYRSDILLIEDEWRIYASVK